MNKTTEALKLAYEALHNVQNALLFVSGSVEDNTTSTMTADAHDDADKALAAIREALAEPVNEVRQPDTECVEADGCPTELAVLQRFWREQKAEPVKQGPVKWTDAALLNLMSSVGDGPFGEEDYAVTRRFMERAEEIRSELAPAQPVKQKPVAYVYEVGVLWKKHFSIENPKDVFLAHKIQPLYAAPVDAKAIRAEALEEAAKVCDDESRYSNDAECCAAAIRGLK